MSIRDLKLSTRGSSTFSTRGSSTFKEYQSPRPRGAEARAAAEADRPKPWLDQSASKSRPGVRRNCTTCNHEWVDRYNKDECPKCLTCLSNPFKRIVGEVGKTKQPPTSAMESEKGVCPRANGGPHKFKWGKCTQCGLTEGDHAKEVRWQTLKEVHNNEEAAHVLMPSASTRKNCPKCAFSWLDAYGKDECPKCFTPLSGDRYRRVPGEVGKTKWNPLDAMESESGQCPYGGPHKWKWGKCTQCGRGQGDEAKASLSGGECEAGGRHVFYLGRCVKCGILENPKVPAGAGAHKPPTGKQALPREWGAPERRSCPTCRHSWLDCYGKNECPKCLRPLVDERATTTTSLRSARGAPQAPVPLAFRSQFMLSHKPQLFTDAHIDPAVHPAVAYVNSEAVPGYLRPRSARNPTGYKVPKSRQALEQREASPRPPSARTAHPAFKRVDGRPFEVAADFWERKGCVRVAEPLPVTAADDMLDADY